MHRAIIAALAAALAISIAHAAPIGQPDYDRPGGTYVSLPSASAETCAAQCAADGLCLAWTFRSTDKSCALKAVVTPAQPLAGASSGLAPRAPGFAALVGAPNAAAAPEVLASQRVASLAPRVPAIDLRAKLPAPIEEAPSPGPPRPPIIEEELLGGPGDL